MRIVRPLAVIIAGGLALTACGATPPELRTVRPGTTVYIAAVDPDGDEGDRATVEQKPSGAWVIPIVVPYSTNKSDDYPVEVTLTEDGTFVISDLGGAQVGEDHDDCLAEGEHYVRVDVPESQLRFEPAPTEQDNSSDDCRAGGDETEG